MQQDSTQTKPIRVLLVDDEEIIRCGLQSICQSFPNIEIVGEACNGKEAVSQVRSLQPDVVLMDINMPGMDGITATGAITHGFPEVAVVILTTKNDDELLVKAMQQGASGYLLKSTPLADVAQAIQSANKGYLQLCPDIAQTLRQRLIDSSSPPVIASEVVSETALPAEEASPSTFSDHRTIPTISDITPRESEVLQLIGEGANNREISGLLNISEKTVKNHVSNILSRVGLRDRTQLAIWMNNPQAATSRFLFAPT